MTTIAIGTMKGAFLVDWDTGEVSEPLFPGWQVTAFGQSGDHYLTAVNSNWFGVGIQRSTDLQEWTPTDAPPAFAGTDGDGDAAGGDGAEGEDGSDAADGSDDVKAIWTFHRTRDALWAGVQDAAVFRSTDDGVTWTPVDGFNDHPTRDQWGPGLGGLCAHRILGDDDQLYVAASAVGVFRSDDGGETFEPCNDGVPAVGLPDDVPRPEVGYCVHGLQMDPDDHQRLWRQDHAGMFQSVDGAANWTRNEDGLPAAFGFVMHRDAASGRLFTQPLHSDGQRIPVDGDFRVYRSDDDGATWQVSGTGWPTAPTHTQVLRGAVAGDGNGKVVMGTTAGTVWRTGDAGETWDELDLTTPRILSVSVW